MAGLGIKRFFINKGSSFWKIRFSIIFIWLFSFWGVMTSCSDKKNKEEVSVDKKQYLQEKNDVGIVILERQSFDKELLSNGKLTANQKNVLKFKVDGNLKKLLVKNGDVIRKGQPLAYLDDFEYQQELNSSEISFKKARLEFEDMLVGRGYDLQNKENIPENIYEMASIRSGYSEAENQLENAKFDVNSTVLRAPFSGKVADIKFKEFEQVNAGEEFMSLIDDSVFDVEFNLIESEVNQIKKGEDVEIQPFNTGKGYFGKIISINPIVKENGMVDIKARVQNDGPLMEGMNVKVIIQKNVPNQFVVPKDAVLIRDNQEILFKYQKGKAYWTYIQTIYENSTSYAIIADPNKNSAHLREGDSIIVSGNLNLAHDSEVTVKSTFEPSLAKETQTK
ncbi:efflux RND transporter periplasmic adaptor subunit [Sinomicrobium weinanense]|uniref:Efflux RND transporter periplasmic adaptor subunit n=1 Tax=Sinomicrobium weinanense TaxID=2842200 RepID=A0A926Q3Q8_9FLAO|nr:efflux RND transporter periplasmic adaptor subunit [Sinomicrobium weinanense]MBC9797813.1 efflux RND transporter periplasmic adaptor subunit [Sinomicrobium weinanense]MBU3125962.1 efflux RND transporter periplasmic adaptor subunit [Sinomicrobium weinanense]